MKREQSWQMVFPLNSVLKHRYVPGYAGLQSERVDSPRPNPLPQEEGAIGPTSL